PAYGPQNDVTLKMPAFEWVHVQLHQQKGMISLSPPTICNSAIILTLVCLIAGQRNVYHLLRVNLAISFRSSYAPGGYFVGVLP
ncbi:hypothetical protein M5D24_24720, partial [Salmonella enterica]|nr:hypothetical protein [Salmonella enterica]